MFDNLSLNLYVERVPQQVRQGVILIDPTRIELPDIPEHPTKHSKFDPTKVIWRPANKRQPNKVIVDERVQRVFRDSYAKDISAAWRTSMADPVHISVRKDGTKSIIDGQHTTWAAADNGLTSLHCIEHTGLTLAQEAAFHLRKQGNRKDDSATDKWALNIAAEIPEFVAANQMLRKYGIIVGSHIRAAASLDFVVRQFGADTLERVVRTMNAWCGGAAKREDWTANSVIRALGYLHGHHPHVADPVALGLKLQKKTTPRLMDGAISGKAKGGGGTGSRYLIGAGFIAEIWNVRRAPANQYPTGVLGNVIPSDDEDDEDE